jgi:hypothetical protein
MKSAVETTAPNVTDSVNPAPSQTISGNRQEPDRVFLTTPEAAAYLRRSVSWLLRQPDIAYLPGKPNLYALVDLDVWVERHKVRPRVRV